MSTTALRAGRPADGASLRHPAVRDHVRGAGVLTNRLHAPIVHDIQVETRGEVSLTVPEYARAKPLAVVERHHDRIREHGTDLPEVADWAWRS